MKTVMTNIGFFKAFLKTYTALLRVFIALLVGGAALFPLAASSGAARAQGISLKYDSVIEDNVIRLGDLFENLPRGKDKILGGAPRPGTEMVLDVRTLMRIAKAMDLEWRPATAADQVVLRRAATIIDTQTVTAMVLEALAREGVKGKYDLIYSQSGPEIVLPADQPLQAEVTSIKTDNAHSMFEAALAAPSKENPVRTLNVTGRLERLADVPVLRETLKNGTVIGRHDLDFIEMPAHALKADMVITPENLIGMTPRRMIKAGEPVKTIDLEEPKIVARGESVTIVFRNGPLYLTAQGKAMEHGAKGDLIRVVNSGSSKTVEAVVTASREVTIEAPL